MKRFDRKFGADLLASLPAAPAVYLFRDESRDVVYVGKAKDVRARLSRYRNASRRKAHRKMRAIVREAATLEVRLQPTEQQALLVENELIRAHEPRFNVDGKFSFLYPAIGVGRGERHTLLCFTTDVEAWSGLDLRWFGAFRSRLRVKEGFDALVELLSLLGHRDRTSALGPMPDARGSRIVGLRQLDPALLPGLEGYLGGRSLDGLAGLATALLDKPRARRDAPRVQAHLRLLRGLFRDTLAPLREVLREAGRAGTFVPQRERDALFIAARSA